MTQHDNNSQRTKLTALPCTHQQGIHGTSESSTSSTSPLKPNQALPSLAAKRKAASQFIKECTGVAPPYATDQGFRAALKDGLLLCKVVNTVWPDAVKQVSTACWCRMAPALIRSRPLPHCSCMRCPHATAARQLASSCMLTCMQLCFPAGAGARGCGVRPFRGASPARPQRARLPSCAEPNQAGAV